MKEQTTTIPAQPGCFLSFLIQPNNAPAYFEHEPIIAWDVQREETDGSIFRWTTPFTADNDINELNVDHLNDDCAIKRPDGTFLIFGSDAKYQTDPEAIEYLSAQLAPTTRQGDSCLTFHAYHGFHAFYRSRI